MNPAPAQKQKSKRGQIVYCHPPEFSRLRFASLEMTSSWVLFSCKPSALLVLSNSMGFQLSKPLPPTGFMCLSCGEHVIAQPKLTLMGFQQFVCERCKAKNIYPLAPTYRRLYIILASLFGIMTVYAISNGQIPRPGLIAIIALCGLIQDFLIRKKISKNSSGQPAKSPPPLP